MRALSVLALVLASGGCTVAHYPGYNGDDRVAHGTTGPTTRPAVDAWLAPGTDGGPPADDAWSAPLDAWVRPGEDAWVAPASDAWTMPVCPTFSTDVAPLYVRHCANCHTTGREVHFGSSYSVANQSSSGCGGSMAACTIQLGRPGGSMARRDPYGGFSTSDIALIQAWIDCGRPM